MSLRVLVIPDKFKGTLSAATAADAIARGWHRIRPQDRLDLLPMSDGGDGFGEVMGLLLGARSRRLRTIDAAHRRCEARWWWDPRQHAAVIESARIIGLAMLPAGRFHPFQLDTFGLGEVLRAAARNGARHCWVGIGGSATNDGGFGLSRALGWQFLDANGREIRRWLDLANLVALRAPPQQLRFKELVVAVDVQNPLLGRYGATRVYGPQKGLHTQDFPMAESALGRLATVVRKALGRDVAREPGTGAAGGLGFGLAAFMGARLEPGFELFSRQAALERRLRQADVVITGEGAIDRSTLMGKGVGQIALACRKVGRPCLALAGRLTASAALRRVFTQTCALTELTSQEKARAKAGFWLARLAENAARNLSTRL